MRHLLPSVLLAAALFTSGCGPDCQSSCDRLFGDGPDECNIPVPGHDTPTGISEVVNDCVAHCERALSENGDVGAYDPNSTRAGDQVFLENEKQAALWMDCVSETECSNLQDGMCAPTQNFQ